MSAVDSVCTMEYGASSDSVLMAPVRNRRLPSVAVVVVICVALGLLSGVSMSSSDIEMGRIRPTKEKEGPAFHF